MDQRIEYIIDEIIDQYQYADTSLRPWVIGFSGGKDSTVLLMLVWLALERIKQHRLPPIPLGRTVYVVCNDTLVENPIIATYVDDVLKRIEKKALEDGLPIQVCKTTPKLEDSFWVNVIGKGYPVPNTAFRWCTERLKIKPTARFILDKVDEYGEAILLIGTRRAESATRARSVKRHEIRGKRLSPHPLLRNAYVYAPIKELSLEEVWYIINTIDSPWGFDNSILFNIYKDASADDYECPTMVTDTHFSSCGQSRFGCWVCTVVKEDKSMRSLIKNGREWMQPLYDFRQSLETNRNDISKRFRCRRDGRPAVNNMGTYTFVYRAEILRKLLETQQVLQSYDSSITLISVQELIAIQIHWYRDFNFLHQVPQIYNLVYKNSIDMEDTIPSMEHDLMCEVCDKTPKEGELIGQLLLLLRSKAVMRRRHGLQDDIETDIKTFLNPKQ